MNSLFLKEIIRFNLTDAELEYYPNFFNDKFVNECFERLQTEVPWQQDSITVYGKTYFQPRLTALYGNEGKSYSYSNFTMQPHS